MGDKAVVLLSGGLDSTACLALALDVGVEAYPLTFWYGQRHSRELEAAQSVCKHYGLPYKEVDTPLDSLVESSLVGVDGEIPHPSSVEDIGQEIPSTYVPGRNIIFLSYAAAYAETVGANLIYIGANSLDYSGYPDCRPKFLLCFEDVINVGMKSAAIGGSKFKIMAPLLQMSKKQIVLVATTMSAPIELTWSCYKGDRRPCGKCDSCLLRAKGFGEAGVVDAALKL